MRYAFIDKCEYTNGEGIGVSLFVQGCRFRCKNCFNPETWDFDGGKEFTYETEKYLYKCINKPYIDRVTILGGEPLCDENVGYVNFLIRSIRDRFPEKKIWLYTGYTFDEIFSEWIKNDIGFNTRNRSPYDRFETICCADTVVEGRFEEDKVDTYNEKIIWAGSYNQRVIDIKEMKQNIFEHLQNNKFFCRKQGEG